VVFLFDFFVELLLSQRKRRYLLTHFLFFLVSIPYLAIFEWLDLDFSAHIEYLIRFIPLVKGGYAMAIVVGWFTYNKATGLFVTYMVTFVATVYFGSVAFYIFERGVNQAVTCYADALWWASMDVTTVGSDIVAVTPVGRVLSVILAALGMMMLPIFTVYVTSLITDKRTSADVLRLNGAIPPDAGNPK
jgi:voltage-gated potassium channel Kch